MILLLIIFAVILPIAAIFAGMSMAPALGILSVAAGSVSWRRLRAAGFGWRRTDMVLAGLLLGWPLLTAIWSIVPGHSLEVWWRVTLTMLAGMVWWRSVEGMDFPGDFPLAVALVGGLFMASVFVVIELLTGGGMIKAFLILMRPDHAKYHLVDLNRGACIMALMVWPVMIGMFRRGMGWWMALVPLMVFGAVLGLESLSAKLAVVTGIVAWLGVRFLPKLWVPLLRWGLPTGLLLWPVLFQFLGNPFDKGAFFHHLPESAQHRVKIWYFTFDHAVEKPLLGWGMDASRAIPGGTLAFKPAQAYLPMHPHNSMMQVFLEQGLVGLGLTVLAVWLLFRRWSMWEAEPQVKALMAAAMVGYLTIAMTGFGMWQYWWISTGWLVAGYCLAASRIRGAK